MAEFEARLKKIEGEVSGRLKDIHLLPFDKWLMASGLQKAIRRGEEDRAASFALSLWNVDKRALYRRLSVIAVEDVGMAALDTVLDVTVACKSPAWRRAVGDAAVAVHLAQRMACVPKTRYLTELYLHCDLSEATAKARTWAANAPSAKLAHTLLNPDTEPYERAIALWGLLGTRKFPGRKFNRPDGDMERAMQAIKRLPVPDDLIRVCLASMNDVRWPLMAFLPIGWLAMQKEGPHLHIREERPISSPETRGLPTYTLDGLYTRSGQDCVKRFQAAVPGLKTYSPKQIGEAVFLLEAEIITPRMTSPSWDAFRQENFFTIMLHLGLDRDDYMALQRSLIKNFDLYNDIRLKKIEAIGVERPDLFSAAGE